MIRLSETDRAMLGGAQGEAAAFAMTVLSGFAASVGAPGLLDITQAHIDGCLHHGQVSLDFVDRLAAGGGQVRVPTTLNVGSMDLIHPELVRAPPALRADGRRLMEAHLALGCAPSFTCAPYQTAARPAFGQQIAWGESNAIIFANSVIGARTNRYGDFIDLCCAITGRAPAWGLHLDENRHGTVLFRLSGFPPSLPASDALYVAIGHIIGSTSGDAVPVIEGLPPPDSEDQIKALGAVAASAGSVALFHAVGLTPEAPDLATALGGRPPVRTIAIHPDDVAASLAGLSTVPEGTAISAVCLGTPHFSEQEWNRLLALLRHRPAPAVPIYVNTGRETWQRLATDGRMAVAEAAGIIPVVDTCTYITAILGQSDGAVMTNSGKWAHYAPSNLGVDVAFGALQDCIASATAGHVVRHRSWR
ncbi:MAG TPA: aconitase X catalytic domain-containing protein [Acetobacteraceae bacterium]